MFNINEKNLDYIIDNIIKLYNYNINFQKIYKKFFGYKNKNLFIFAIFAILQFLYF